MLGLTPVLKASLPSSFFFSFFPPLRSCPSVEANDNIFRGKKFTRAMKKKRPQGVTHLTSIPLLSGGDGAKGHTLQKTEKNTPKESRQTDRRTDGKYNASLRLHVPQTPVLCVHVCVRISGETLSWSSRNCCCRLA